METEVGVLRPVAQAMRAGKGKVLVGAGLSMQSGLGSWLELLTPVIKDGLGIDLQWYDDLPEIAQYYCDRVPGGRDRLVSAIAADVNKPATPTDVHRALATLPVAECWTTNFDTLLEQCLLGHLVVGTDAELSRATRQPKPLLVKMHGSLPTTRPTPEQVERLVLTRNDFDRYEDEHPRLWSRIAASYLSGAMLFLGLSLTDPNMRLLHKLARAAQRTGVDASSVVVLNSPSERQDQLRFESRTEDLARSGVTVLTIDSHDDLAKVLRRLRTRLRPPRVIISGSTNSLDPGGKDRAIRAAELLGAKLAEKALPIVHGGSDTGTAVARRLAEVAEVVRTYDPTAITAVRRRVLHGSEYIAYPPGPGAVGMPRDGTIRFIGETPEQMRDELARLGCVVALIGGGTGTCAEINMFSEAGLPIVPWPATGGVAHGLTSRLDAALEHVAADRRRQIRDALHSSDIERGAVAMAVLLEAIQQPYADMGPTSDADPLRPA